ncbi:heavy metal transporter [Mycobacterium gordonae]|uniref:Heavy metal transporter n=1 Tax=Mycobacterium gordonae TaxID=1778 RepID=A0A0Q2LIZ0_MYCGO|nr:MULTISPECIES: heavy metal-associated domain-containing protein [Mycobacterium]KQH76209.1 heavy metal transporter [Mycobacterium gordonae]MDP7732836.1 heavy metal-associated domain-containing protein [Mycobacterium sp. TY813]
MDTITLRVRGMSCAGCEERIGAVLRRVEGVRDVSADHVSGRVQIRVGAELPGREVLVERIAGAGYEVVEEAPR